MKQRRGRRWDERRKEGTKWEKKESQETQEVKKGIEGMEERKRRNTRRGRSINEIISRQNNDRINAR